jgi:hypothetical protein
MPRWQLRYAIVCAAITGWCIAYALAAWGQWPRLLYDPLARSFRVAAYPGGPVPIDYWGLVSWGLGGALVGAAISLCASLVWRRPIPRALLPLLGLWSLTALLFAGSYFTYTLGPWR